MKNGSKSLRTAEVEVMKVRFGKGTDLGIELSNEIDAWVRMQFKFCHQIRQLRDWGKVVKTNPSPSTEFRPLRYAIREKVD